MERKTTKITDLLTLLVFTLFALCVLLVLLSGARVYRNLVARGSESYEARTAVQYIATRVRQGETVGVENFGGCDALVLREQINGRTYATRVYCHGGYLRELFSAEEARLAPEDGEKVIEAESVSFDLEGRLLTARVDSRKLQLELPVGKELGP